MIEIRGRLHPFSHRPGMCCLIPGTPHLVQAFPTLLRLNGKEIDLDIQGPVDNFTLVQDLEHQCVTIFSQSYCYHVLPNLEVVSTKHPKTPAFTGPRYHFGVHKKPQWESICQRLDIAEIFPIWLRLGSLLQLPRVPLDFVGPFQLLRECEQVISVHRPEAIEQTFIRLFRVGFRDLMVPRSKDTDFQGILSKEAPESTTDPLYLLTEGAQLIRSLFLRECDNELAILPDLPPALFAGRIVNEKIFFGHLSIQWQQKRLREMELKATRSGELQLHLPPSIRRFRLLERGEKRGVWVERGTALAIEALRDYRLDRFER